MQNSIRHIKYVLLIGRDVTRGKHHVMKSSRPSPSFLCLGSKVAIHLSRAGREKAWSRGYLSVRANLEATIVLPVGWTPFICVTERGCGSRNVLRRYILGSSAVYYIGFTRSISDVFSRIGLNVSVILDSGHPFP